MTTNLPSYPDFQKKTNGYFIAFLLLHVLIWTIGPWWVRYSLPHDTLESISWGSQWQLGYNKHPFLAAWVSAAMVKWFQAVDWPIYLLSQLAVLTTWLASWRLARYILPPVAAIVATMALDGVLFYNINSFNFTPDTLQSPLWALLSLFFYRALTTQRWRDWMLTGCFAALCVITKYQVALLFLPMLLLCLTNRQARRSFSNPGMYVGVGLALVLLLPHLHWLIHSDWVTVRYALKTAEQYGQPSRWYQPTLFILNSLGYVAGVFVLLWPFYRTIGNASKPFVVPVFQSSFLLWIGLGPFALTVLLCVITGEHYPIRWATPYFFLVGCLILAKLKLEITPIKWRQFIVTLLIFSSTLWVVRIGSIAYAPRERSDAFLPNQTMAKTLHRVWEAKTDSKLVYLAGSRYLVTSLVPYFPHPIIPFLNWDLTESPWVNEEDWKIKGGLVVWDLGHNYIWDAGSAALTSVPESVRERYPNLQWLGTYTFYRHTPAKTPVQIGVGIVLPNPFC